METPITKHLQERIDKYKARQFRNALTTKAAFETDHNEYCKIMRLIEASP